MFQVLPLSTTVLISFYDLSSTHDVAIQALKVEGKLVPYNAAATVISVDGQIKNAIRSNHGNWSQIVYLVGLHFILYLIPIDAFNMHGGLLLDRRDLSCLSSLLLDSISECSYQVIVHISR